MGWYLTNILIMSVTEAAFRASSNSIFADVLLKNRLGAIIIATLFKPILFFCSFWYTFQRSISNIYMEKPFKTEHLHYK